MKSSPLWVSHRGTESSAGTTKSKAQASLERMLESVVMLNWADLMPKTAGGLVDVEYRFLPDKSLEYLRLWACSERRFCDLICQYSMFWRWSLSQNVSLGKGYKSQELVDSLDYVIQHLDHFASKASGVNKLVQVSTPSATQVETARQFVAGIVI